jgi:hypothetical protein
MARKYWYPSDFDAGLCSKAQIGTVRDFSEPVPEAPAVWPADEPAGVSNELPEDSGEVVEPSPVAEPKRKGK